MDTGKMLDAAMGVVVKVLVEKAALPALTGVWDWVKRRLGPGSEAVTEIAAKPEDTLAKAKLTLALAEVLKDPAAAAELAALLQQAQAAGATTQTLDVSGDNAKVAQTAGTNNKVSIR